MKPQFITLLEIDNYKRITAFKAQFDPAKPGGVVILSGENEAGKSSVLDGILSAITGELPAEPLKRGATKGRVVLKTQDFVFTQRLTEKGCYFELSTPEGQVYKSPRTLLAKFYSAIGFDPLFFAQAKESDRTEQLLRVCPVKIDLAANAKESKALYDERTAANREVGRIEAVLKSLPVPAENPPQPVSVTALNSEKNKRLASHQERNDGLNAELEKLREQERGHITKRQALKDAQSLAAVCLEQHTANLKLIAELTKQLEEAESKQVDLQKELDSRYQKTSELTTEVGILPDLLPQATALKTKLAESCDTADLDAQIADAEKVNAIAEEARQQANARTDAANQLSDAKKEAERLDEDYKAKVQERADALKAAKFPVDGLLIDDEGLVRLNGTLFSECSTAQQIRVGVALAASASPAMRVVTVRDGSLLDDKSMAVLKELAEKHQLQVWIERVSDTSDGAIQIVDGNNQ